MDYVSRQHIRTDRSGHLDCRSRRRQRVRVKSRAWTSRLIKVVHSGTVNNNVTAEYTHDHADNRVNVKITGAP